MDDSSESPGIQEISRSRSIGKDPRLALQRSNNATPPLQQNNNGGSTSMVEKNVGVRTHFPAAEKHARDVSHRAFGSQQDLSQNNQR